MGTYVRNNAEAIYGTKRMEIYPYEVDWGMLTRKDHKLYLHVFKPRVRLELLNIANTITDACLVSDGRKLEFDAAIACEGNSIIEVEIPADYHNRAYYTVCLQMAEPEPIFEPIRG